MAWSSGGSGFAWSFPRPAYQSVEVTAYLAKHATDSRFPKPGSFNAQGRVYPDVAALADQVMHSGALGGRGGLTGVCRSPWSSKAVYVVVQTTSVFAHRTGQGQCMHLVSISFVFFCRHLTCLSDQVTGGTSAAAPEWAGVISLLNDLRLNLNLPPLGFVNPRFYAAARAG